MRDFIDNSNIAIIGGGKVAKEILAILLNESFKEHNITIRGIADINNSAEGIQYARKKGIITTNDYIKLLDLKNIDLIIETTNDDSLPDRLGKILPKRIKIINHYEVMALWDYLKIEEHVCELKRNIKIHKNEPLQVEKFVKKFYNDLTGIFRIRTQLLYQVRKFIKERKRVKNQLQHSKEKYNILFNNDPNAIIIIDKESFKIVDANKSAREFYGMSKKEFQNMSFLDLGGKNDEELIEKVKDLAAGKLTILSKKKHYKKNGRPFYVNIKFITTTYNEQEAFIAIITDISKVVEKEMQIIQASKMTTLGTMAAGIAHELNQPLNVIQVGADFFLKKINREEKIDRDDLENVATEIYANVHRASEIINQLRYFSRKSEVISKKIDINAPIRDVFSLLGQQLRVHQIELKLNLSDNLPKIMADHNRLMQVFINLVVNSMDALNEKAKKFKNKKWKKVLSIQSFKKNNYVMVKVMDTGAGMPDNIKEKIFELFFTTKEVGKGTGLGTSIAYSIINDFDGSISVKSEIDVGTTFEIKFPKAGK